MLDEIAQNFNDRFVSFAFEDYLLEDLLRAPEKYFDFIPVKAGRWWNNKEEIDIVAFDEENIAFIECKWQNRVDKTQVRNRLIQKAQALAGNKKATYLVITKDDYLGE